MNRSNITGFNYLAIQSNARGVVQAHAEAIHSLFRKNSTNVVNIGRRLIAVRQLLAKEEYFVAWLAAEVRFGQQTARNYIAVAERFGELDVIENFQPSALYSLVKPSFPAPALEQAIAMARSGELVTNRKVQELAVKARPTGGTGPRPSQVIHLRNVAKRLAGLLGARFIAAQLLSVVEELRQTPATA